MHCPLNPFKTQKWVFEIGLLYTNYFARKFSKCVLVNIYIDFCQLTVKKLKKVAFFRSRFDENCSKTQVF